MRKRTFLFICILFGCSLQSFDCKKSNKGSARLQKGEDLEKDTILKIAADTAVKLYGYKLIKNELPLMAYLTNDSIWVVTGTLKKNTKGGTVYAEISRLNKKVLQITHYK